MLFSLGGERIMTERIRKRLGEKIIKFDNWTMSLVRDGNFRMAGGEEERFGGVVVRVGGEDGEELRRSFSAGAGDEDCHIFIFFLPFFLFLGGFFLFFVFCISWGRERLGFGLMRRDGLILVGGRHGRKVSKSEKVSK